MKVNKERMIKHAQQFDLFIHPKIFNNWNKWIRDTNILGRCPCSPRRRECPCPESVKECKKGHRGACICTVFVSQKYIDKFADISGLEQLDFFKPGIRKNDKNRDAIGVAV